MDNDELYMGTASTGAYSLGSSSSLIPNNIYISLFENKDGHKWRLEMDGRDITFTDGEITIKFSKEFLNLFKDALDMVSEVDWEQEIEND